MSRLPDSDTDSRHSDSDREITFKTTLGQTNYLAEDPAFCTSSAPNPNGLRDSLDADIADNVLDSTIFPSESDRSTRLPQTLFLSATAHPINAEEIDHRSAVLGDRNSLNYDITTQISPKLSFPTVVSGGN